MNLKIAVCDDELLFRTRIAKALTDNLNQQGIFDYQMELFQSGRELCELKEELRQFDALFLDISMPDENGMQVAEYVRNIHPNIALIFITSYNQVGNHKVHLSNGEELPIPRERFCQVKEQYYVGNCETREARSQS